MRPQVGQVINNKYRLIRLIGDGGMGSVFEARHEVLGTTVALKFLHPELSRRAGLVQRFLQEAQVSAQIKSPHVVHVTDVDQNQNGQAFIVMEYLEGKTLQTLYEELYHARQRLSYADALEYAMQMLEGVEAAHASGVVHRDLKPDNVIITRGKRGEPILKLLDFGIAKLKVTGQLDRGLTRPGIIMGTPEYMAPEQAYSADAVDARADIFSLGVMIFEMLAGRRPVGGDEPHQIASAYLTRNIAKLGDLAPHVPADLATAVHRAMGPKPEDRFSSVADFRASLEPFWLATRPAATPAPPGASVVTPAPASPAGGSLIEGARRVPKTLPPEDEAPAAMASPAPAPSPAPQLAPSGGQSIEVVFSSGSPAAASVAAASIEPSTTPVSKAPSFDEVGATPQPADPASVVVHSGGAPVNGAAAFAATDASMNPAFAGTVESPPIFVGSSPIPAAPSPDASPANGQPGTVEAQPLFQAQPSQDERTERTSTANMPLFVPERAGGTAVGAPLFQGGSPGGADASAPYNAVPAGMPATASMDPAPYVPTPAPGASPRRGRSTGASLALILLAAAAVSGAVVGGLWYAQQRAKDQDRDEPPVATTPPQTSVRSEPTIPTAQPRIPTAQPPVTRPPTTGPKPPTTSTAPPLPSATPSGSASAPPVFPTAFPTAIPTALPSGFPTAIPTSLIPIPLPTLIPFPPFPPQQQQPGTQPGTNPGANPGSNPSPTPTRKRPGGPLILNKLTDNEIHITIRRPKRTANPDQQAPQNNTNNQD